MGECQTGIMKKPGEFLVNSPGLMRDLSVLIRFQFRFGRGGAARALFGSQAG